MSLDCAIVLPNAVYDISQVANNHLVSPSLQDDENHGQTLLPSLLHSSASWFRLNPSAIRQLQKVSTILEHTSSSCMHTRLPGKTFAVDASLGWLR